MIRIFDLSDETVAAVRLLLAETFGWVEGERPYRVARADSLRAALSGLGYALTLPLTDEVTAESYEEARRLLVWADYDGFDRHGRAQLRIGFRDNRPGTLHAERLEALAGLLEILVRPYGFRVERLTRFSAFDTIQLVG